MPMKPTEEFIDSLMTKGGFKLKDNKIVGANFFLERIAENTFKVGLMQSESKIFAFDIITVGIGETVRVEGLKTEYSFDLKSG